MPARWPRPCRPAGSDTLAHFRRLQQALPGLQVPQQADAEPAAVGTGPHRLVPGVLAGTQPAARRRPAADPLAPRHAPLRAEADALYDSSAVAHASRWSLPLPDADATCADLAAQLDGTLALLAPLADADPASSDAALYFFRLALVHEDMHHEAGLYMAQALGIAVDDARWQPRAARAARSAGAARPAAGTWAARPAPALPSTTNCPATAWCWAPARSTRRCCAGPTTCPSWPTAAMPTPACGPLPAMPGARPMPPAGRRACASRTAPGSSAATAAGRRCSWPSRPAT